MAQQGMTRSKQDGNEAGKTMNLEAPCPAPEAHNVIKQDPKGLGIPILTALPSAAHTAFLSGCLHSMLEALLGECLMELKIPVTWGVY